jgi:hypothetical protein
MDAVTYPSEQTENFLSSHFECTKVSVADKSPEARAAVRGYRHLWAPGFVVFDQRGEELRRFLGYQAPREFMAELTVALGKVRMLHRDPAGAFEAFRSVADLEPPAPVTPEAIYWAGVAAYQRDRKDLDFLREYWEELRTRFPESRWWTAADVY